MKATWDFKPAVEYRDQHGLFVALIGGPNSGKTYSSLRLARGIAGPAGKIAVLDTEGGRTLHLKADFKFDCLVMGPPHRPGSYLAAAQAAQDKGYDALVIDSWSQEWRGLGGVLDWADDEAEAMLARKRERAAANNWNWDEAYERDKVKMASLIRPKMAHKLMMNGLLGLRIPIIFSVRGEMSVDPNPKPKPEPDGEGGQQGRGRAARSTGPVEIFKALCDKNFPFELTVSFRLSNERKGVIDLSDPKSWKMEAAHRAIFQSGDLLCEDHGARLIAWARGAEAVEQAKAQAAQAAEKPRRTLGEYLDECLSGCQTRQDVTRLVDEDPIIKGAMDRKQVRERVDARFRSLAQDADADSDIDAAPLAAAE